MTVRLEIQQLSSSPAPSPARLSQWVAIALEGRAAEFCLRIVDEEEMRLLNRRYRSQDRPTNVLAFPLELPPALAAGQLGDLVICAPLVLHEARAGQKSPEAHWAHLLTHGLLHLLGYDHGNPEEAHRMEQRETQLLARMAFPDPYATHPGDDVAVMHTPVAENLRGAPMPESGALQCRADGRPG